MTGSDSLYTDLISTESDTTDCYSNKFLSKFNLFLAFENNESNSLNYYWLLLSLLPLFESCSLQLILSSRWFLHSLTALRSNIKWEGYPAFISFTEAFPQLFLKIGLLGPF